jgi:hypothetical protein
MDHRSLSLWLCALVACSGRPAPEHPLSGSAPASNLPTRTCITRSANELDTPSADSITIAGDGVKLCFGMEPDRSCWRIDVATKEIAPRPVTASIPAAPVAKAEARADGTIKVCGPGGSPCTSFALAGLPQHPQWVAVSDDLSTVAIPDDATLHVYDVATAKLRATIHGWPDSPMFGDSFNYAPTFAAPDRMIVWYAWTPVSEQGRIFDMSGKQLAIVGKDFWSLDPDKNSWRVHGTEWAILSEANEIVTVDVKHPSVTSRYDLSALFALPRPENDHRLLNVLAVAGSAQHLIIVTGENPVTIGVLDRNTNALEKLEPPRCGNSDGT